MDYVLGLDIGTSGAKVLLVEENGKIVGSASRSYLPDFGANGYVEQDPAIWWEAILGAIKDILEKYPEAKGRVVALSASGQMHSSVFLDSEFKVIRKAILWNDTRTTKQTKEIYEAVGGKQELLDSVCNLALEGFTLPKILWLRENEPESFARVSKVVLPKDYINFMLTGELVTEVSDAAGTLLFDVRKSEGAREVFDALKLDASMLPKAISSTERVGVVKEELAKELCLAKDCVVIAGGADNSCGGVGNGVINKGDAVISVGTSGTVVASLDEIPQRVDGSVHLFNYSVPDKFYAMGCMLCAGEALNWLKRCFFEDLDMTQLNELANSSSCGANGLIFLPYLYGERTPHNNANAKGMFFGIKESHTKADFVRAVMEGVAYGIKDLYMAVSEFSEIENLYMTGGGAKSVLWKQIIADILGREIEICDIEEGPSFGAALIALVGCGRMKDMAEAKEKTFSIKERIYPEEVKEYKKGYEIYRLLYNANKDVFKKM